MACWSLRVVDVPPLPSPETTYDLLRAVQRATVADDPFTLAPEPANSCAVRLKARRMVTEGLVNTGVGTWLVERESRQRS
jgi:hypothetical protein